MSTAMHLSPLVLIAAVCFAASVSRAETAIVVDRDGVGTSAKFGDKVEVEVNATSGKIVLGDEEYPRASFAFQEDGCFAVGIEAGIEQGVFQNPEFNGRWEHAGPDSIGFTATIAQEISAGVEICPELEEPMLLDPSGSDGEPGSGLETQWSLYQRMIVTRVSSSDAGGAGDRILAGLEGYCRDRSLKTPQGDTKFKVKPDFAVSPELKVVLDNDRWRDPYDQNDCIWATYPAEFWPPVAETLLGDFDDVPSDEDLEALRTQLAAKLAREENRLEHLCGFRPALAASVPDGVAEEFMKCVHAFRSDQTGFPSISDARARCWAQRTGTRPKWWLIATALAICAVVGTMGVWYVRRRR